MTAQKSNYQIRHRLMGDLKRDSGSNLYDEELMQGYEFQKKRNGYKTNKFRPGRCNA
jgi:hypothetical protein